MMVFSVRSRNDECVNEMSASSVVGGGFFCFCFSHGELRSEMIPMSCPGNWTNHSSPGQD